VRLLTLLFCCALLLVGCEKEKSGKAAPASTQPVRAGTATIRGIVTLAGRAPIMATLPNKPCHDRAEPLKDESVVTDESGHLQNVVVYVEDAPPAPPATNLPAVVLDQKNCQYIPHVLALRTAQTMHVTTSDSVIHNVHGLCAVNEPFNFALVRPGQSKDLTFAQPEAFPVRCDVHPWMKAYVHVFAHPYFAVTGADGTFEIPDVPKGTYMLVAWQENYGTLRQKVSTSDHQTASGDFIFQSGH
jgi:hypothetical protein